MGIINYEQKHEPEALLRRGSQVLRAAVNPMAGLWQATGTDGKRP